MVGPHHLVIALHLYERPGVFFRKLGEGAVGVLAVRVDQKAAAVPERDAEVLVGHDVGCAVLVELEVLVGGRLGTEDVEDGVQVEVVAGEDLLGRETASFLQATLQNQDRLAGLGEVVGDCQSIVTRTDDDDVERFHGCPLHSSAPAASKPVPGNPAGFFKPRSSGEVRIDQPLDSTLGKCFNRFQEGIQDSALAPACSLAEKISPLISVT